LNWDGNNHTVSFYAPIDAGYSWVSNRFVLAKNGGSFKEVQGKSYRQNSYSSIMYLKDERIKVKGYPGIAVMK
jgi:hypothetical protein